MKIKELVDIEETLVELWKYLTGNYDEERINLVERLQDKYATSLESVRKELEIKYVKSEKGKLVRKKSPNGRSNIHLSKSVFAFDLNGDLIGQFSSIRKAARELGVNEGTAWNGYKRKRPIYKMYYITDSSTFDLK